MEEEIQKLYHEVFKVAKHFLDQSVSFTIQELNGHNEPTYQEVADLANMLAGVINSLASSGGWNEDRIALNARQAALHMEQMALCIVNEDDTGLDVARKQLDAMDFV